MSINILFIYVFNLAQHLPYKNIFKNLIKENSLATNLKIFMLIFILEYDLLINKKNVLNEEYEHQLT